MTATFNHFKQIGDKLPKVVGEIVRKTALDIEAGAKQRVPVDTGFLKSSIQTEVVSDTEAHVNVGAEYAAYVEYGTYKMAAQPYLTPAIEEARPKFNAALAKLGDGIKGSIA